MGMFRAEFALDLPCPIDLVSAGSAYCKWLNDQSADVHDLDYLAQLTVGVGVRPGQGGAGLYPVIIVTGPVNTQPNASYNWLKEELDSMYAFLLAAFNAKEPEKGGRGYFRFLT